MQNYSNYSRLYVISNYRHSSVSQTILHKQITKYPDPVRIRSLSRKPESGSCRTQAESGSKKSSPFTPLLVTLKLSQPCNFRSHSKKGLPIGDV